MEECINQYSPEYIYPFTLTNSEKLELKEKIFENPINCPMGWSGVDCDVDINECDLSNPCGNGNCTNTRGSYRCDCNIGYEMVKSNIGESCDDIDECFTYNKIDICGNEAKCINELGTFRFLFLLPHCFLPHSPLKSRTRIKK